MRITFIRRTGILEKFGGRLWVSGAEVKTMLSKSHPILDRLDSSPGSTSNSSFVLTHTGRQQAVGKSLGSLSSTW